MYNPFKECTADNRHNLDLIERALQGQSDGLQQLIGRHQAWVFNIAFKMTADINDAEDVTQEILIKMMTKLSSYNPEKGAFRTWLYRIMANHVINMKKRHQEVHHLDIDDIGNSMSLIPSIPGENRYSSPESAALLEESKLICLNGLLLCLNRTQRLVFILGGVFDVSGKVGSEILEISEANFRKILSRAREKVGNFFNQKCGLIDENNPCRCSRFLKVLTTKGMIMKGNLISQYQQLGLAEEIINDKMRDVETSYKSAIEKLYGSQPFLKPPDYKAWVGKVVQSPGFRELFSL